jgi:signal transduction histidine kinase
MSASAPTSITEQELASMLHALDLLRSQVKSGRLDQEYTLRQIEKMLGLVKRFESQQKEQKSAGRFEALYNVSLMLGTSLDTETVLKQVMDAIIQLTGAERGFVMLRDDDGELQVKVARNYDQQTLTSEHFRYSRTIANYVMDKGEAILTTNASDDPRFKSYDSVVGQALRSIMVAPLRVRSQVIGIAYVENRVIAGLFGSEDLAILEALAGQASVAIDNALLFGATDRALEKRVEELQQLRRIDLKLNEKLDPDAAMLYTLQAVRDLTGATGGHIGLLEGTPPHVVAVHHEEPGTVTRQSLYLENIYPRVWEVVRTGKLLMFDTGLYGMHTVLIVPVLREKRVIGVVILKREDGTVFTEEQQDLAERVVTRASVAIENARLYVAVQAADRAKSEFVGVVAHDLKAPMTSIQGYADLMLMPGNQNLSDKQRQYLQRISSTVKRMEMLVQDLADISRIESGQFFMDETRLTVASIVETLRETTMPQIEARKHHYVEDIAPDLPDIWADYYRLMQVLTNLVSNAYKYTPEGGTITLRVRLQEADKSRVYFEVQDTGIGMSEQNLKMLGTKFWRAEDEFTRSQPGTGLGFAITSALVRQMGSKMDVQSKIGEGSRFGYSVTIFKDKKTE